MNTPPKRCWCWRIATVSLLSVGAFAIVVPPFVACGGPRAREVAQRNACINNLKQIDGAKEQWARDTYQCDDKTLDIKQIDEYIKGGHPNCPAGGTYTYGNLDEPPRCSIKSHTLPP